MTTQVIHQEIHNPLSFGTVRALIFLLGLLALVGMIYLGQSSQATLTGQRVQDLQEQLERYKRSNAQLEYEIATLSAPDKIAERARALGLHPATISQTVFITVKNYPIPLLHPALAVSNSAAFVSSSDSFIGAIWNEIITRLGLDFSPQTVEATTNP